MNDPLARYQEFAESQPELSEAQFRTALAKARRNETAAKRTIQMACLRYVPGWLREELADMPPNWRERIEAGNKAVWELIGTFKGSTRAEFLAAAAAAVQSRGQS